MFEEVIAFIKTVYKTDEFIPLHEPKFIGNEKKYLNECIESTFVSSVGKFVDKFEENIAAFVGAKYAVATSNGTSALHVALLAVGVESDNEVITQPLTFIATCNAIAYCNASPVFVDVDRDTMGMSAKSLRTFLQENAMVENNQCINKSTDKIIKACVPMHTFGHPCKIEEIKEICDEYRITLVEDAAESLGSYYKDKHTGTFGKLGVFSFNGNKIITSGGGGCVVTDDEAIAKKIKHMTTTAKISHAWEYKHDMIAYNYRMPNINAALLVAQLENINAFIKDKRELSVVYKEFFDAANIRFVVTPEDCNANYWLNAIVLKSKKERDEFLKETNASKVMTRPIWALMNKLDMFSEAQCGDLKNALWLEERVVNIPSSVRL